MTAKKTTVADLEARVDELTARLDKAAGVVGAQQKRINALLEQETKTKKQLRFLQKVAKGEIAIGSTPPAKANGEDEDARNDIAF